MTEHLHIDDLAWYRYELATHWGMLLVAVIVLLLSFVLTTDSQLQSVYFLGFDSPLPETCTAKLYTGLGCPGCGLTRAFICISGGRWGDAWRLNPAGFLAYAFTAIQVPWQIFQLTRLQARKVPVMKTWIYLPLIVCSAGMMIQWVWRLV